MASVRADFDRIALLSQEGWDHNSHYHNFLLKHLPAHCAGALEIGCGTGAFSRLLAQRSERVLALDLSPQMIRVARERSNQYPNIRYEVADVLEWAFPTEQYDCIVSIATLHHLPLAEMLGKMKQASKPGGVLLVLDLYQQATVAEKLSSLITFPVSTVLKLLKNRHHESPELRQAWAEHGRTDHYLTLAQVRQACAAVMPGAQVKQHLLWRYSLIWQKPK
ncbi:MAG: methyltransferase domain-containing protein [Anaerolineae bacterium]|nr:methyltransferase domain-containing protein [Anaerolineae bacterium]